METPWPIHFAEQSSGREVLLSTAQGYIMSTDMIGKVIGNCRIEALLGSGGTGQVFRARHSRLNRLQALKLLHTTVADVADYQERFRQEARAIGGLVHSNIVRIFDFGIQEGRCYLSMELLPHGTLRTLLQRPAQSPLPLPLGLDL